MGDGRRSSQHELVKILTWLVELAAYLLFWLAQACTSLYKLRQESCRFTDAIPVKNVIPSCLGPVVVHIHNSRLSSAVARCVSRIHRLYRP